MSYCATPDAIVLNYGLWHKADHARNLAMLEAQLQDQWRHSRGAGSAPPLLVLVLPWRVRRHWSKASGTTQYDSQLASAEPQYVAETLREVGLEMAAMCERFAPYCYALDAWQLSYGRAKDSEDGRHFDYDTPTLNTIMALLTNAVGMQVPPRVADRGVAAKAVAVGCCGVRNVGAAGGACAG